jgi:hypothetical protein
MTQMIDNARRVKGAITIDDAMDRLDLEQEVFILLNTSQNLAVIRGEIVSLRYVDLSDDIEIIVEFKGTEKPIFHKMLLCEMLNGRSACVGDEVDGNLTRMFTLMEDSIKYFEHVQFIRELKALERTSTVSSLISRLLIQRQKPQRDI